MRGTWPGAEDGCPVAPDNWRERFAARRRERFNAKRARTYQRDVSICQAFSQGASREALAERHRVSAERIRQILKAHGML